MIKKKIRIPIFEFYFCVVFDTWANNAKLIEAEGNEPMAQSSRARIFEFKNGMLAIAFNVDIKSKIPMKNVIVHESVHLATCVLQHAGVPISYENDEILAYLTAWFERTIKKIINRHT